MRPYRRLLAGGLACVVISGALGSINPMLLRRGIDSMQPGGSVSTAWRVAAMMLGVSLAGGVFRFGMRQLLNALSRRVEYDLRNDLLQHLLTLDAAYFGRTRTGELMARLTNDLSAVRMAAGPAIMYLVNTTVGGLFALGFMLAIEPRLTALALLPMLPLPWVMIRLGRQIHERFEEVQEHFGAMTTRVQENLAGTRIVRAYRQEAAEERRWRALSEDYLERNLRLARLQALMNPTFALLGGAGTVIVLGAGGALVMRGTITVGDFVAFGMYLTMLVWPLIALGWVTNLFQRASASMERLEQVLDSMPQVTSPPEPRALPATTGGRTLEFRDVGFAYPTPPPLVPTTSEAISATMSRSTEPRTALDVAHSKTIGTSGAATLEPRWVFRHVSFTVPAGATLGIVGATGSGKSALIDLITRTWDPTEGEILLDGVPIRSLSLDTLRRELGVVPQESVLFSDTIRSNLTYGTSDDAAVDWAADVAQLTETIRDFPGGFETILGERGINLSGGQKQRAALARALARRPSIVLLDDALSAVDTHTEAAILHGLREVLAGRTAIIASHRVTAIRDADQIIVLDGGRVVESGTHTTLLARRGRYWTLLARQQLEDEVEDGAPEADTPAVSG
ncbi:MAG: ABC transporter ATP-binding protein [Gemmatimonadaceae bacterium]|nr:ABC transporter ATP-binding protein [Gemmatimonadaceae bacterium]